MKSKDFLLTVAVSVATTLAMTKMAERLGIDQLLAADQESVRELTVDRLIVREEFENSSAFKACSAEIGKRRWFRPPSLFNHGNWPTGRSQRVIGATDHERPGHAGMGQCAWRGCICGRA